MTENELPQINPHDKEIINQIEEIIGKKLKQVTEIQWSTRGYVIKQNGQVSELGMNRCAIDDVALSALIEKLIHLKSLTILFLHNNFLTNISVLQKLPNLLQLDLSSNRLKDISVLKNLAKLTKLTLWDNELREITVLKELPNLRELDLWHNKLRDISVLKELTSLTKLDLSSNQIADISVLEELTNLTKLDLSSNQITDISILKDLSKLKYLHLNNNELTDISILKKLFALTCLSLSKNRIEDILVLKNLPNLLVLNLGYNKISDISVLKELSKLTQLNLSGIELADILILKNLQNLTHLDLVENNLTDISILKNLPNLIQLDLSNNPQLEDISILKVLSNLTQLNLSNNPQLKDISVLKELTNLTKLDLSSNQISDISFLKALRNLTRLKLIDNKVTNVPVELFKKKWDVFYENKYIQEGLNLYENPLETPPVEIVKQGREAVLNYFDSLKKEDIYLFEAKLLIVGRGDVGKSWLTSRLITGNLPKENGTTRGIDIHNWPIKTKSIENFRINFWDFGGQQILHSTHQFFLTKRSLYLFVWDARGDDDLVHFDYWLNIIKLLSDSSPVIVVMNKEDERVKEIEEQTLKNSFRNIIGFYRVSAKENKNIDNLRERIYKEVSILPHIGTRLPKVWSDIRTKLEGLKKPYISSKKYIEICSEFGLNEKQAGFLSYYYHDLGVILHYKDSAILQTVVFLDPEWVTDAVYQLVDALSIQKTSGLFHFDQLPDIWVQNIYPKEMYPKLLELMKKFELCFELEGKGEYIVPELLKADRSDFDWTIEDNLRFEYHYVFMPAGIITRFIARLHDLHKNELYWKNGVILERNNTQALVVSEPLARKIRIRIFGEEKKELLGIIRHNFEYIHETLNQPEVDQMLPCICSSCKEDLNPYFHKYDNLMMALRKGKTKTECKKSYDDVPIMELLGVAGMEKEAQQQTAQNIHYGNNYYGSTHNEKKIRDNYGEAVLGDKNKYGISADEFNKMIQKIHKFDSERHQELKELYQQLNEAKTPEQKDSWVGRIKERLVSYEVGVAGSLTANVISAFASLFQ